MSIRSLIRVLLTCMPLLCCASPLASQTIVLDDFTGPDGMPPVAAKWIHDFDCSQGTPLNLLQGNRLAQSSTIQSGCAQGAGGNTLLTTAQGSNAKLSVQYWGATSTSLNYQGGYAGISLWGTSHLPPSSWSGAGVQPMAGIELRIDAAKNAYVWRVRTSYLEFITFAPGQHPVPPGATLAIDANPGGSIEFKLNDLILHQLTTWSTPPGTNFIAVLGSQPDPALVGSNQTVKWDDFALAFDFGLCSSSPSDTLTASTCAVSASFGGVVNFLFHPVPNFGSELYLIAGSASGTAPGIMLDGLLITLNPDSYTLLTLNGPNYPPFAAFTGFLLAGRAAATLTVPPLALLPLIGTQFYHVGLVLNFVPFLGGPGTLLHVSNVVPLTVIP